MQLVSNTNNQSLQLV